MNTRVGEGEVILVVRANWFRRIVSLAAFVVLACVFIWFAISENSSGLVWKALLVLIGLSCLWLANRFYRETAISLELTADHLRDSTGRILCQIAEIEKVERGAFAFKPSNGLLLKLSQTAPREWHPGLWWRVGRSLAIGGATTAGQSKAMADTIKLLQTDSDLLRNLRSAQPPNTVDPNK